MTLVLETKSLLLHKLICKGHIVDIIDGRIILNSGLKTSASEAWLTKNNSNLIRDFARLLGIDIYQYESYSTGNFSLDRYAGVCLSFINLVTLEEAHIIFNANLERQRTTRNGSKGTSLPKGQFRVGKRHSFCKFWLSTGLDLPNRLSSFHQYMGNLKPLLFVPEVSISRKITNSKKIIPLLNVTHNEILSLFNSKSAFNKHTGDKQPAFNPHTNLTDKEVDVSPIDKGVKQLSNAGEPKYELSDQGSTVIDTPLVSLNKDKSPQEQTNDEWLKDYDEAESI